jgi:hypothetical protein
MKKIITLLLFVAAFSFAGTPTMDGTFDGLGVWGSPIATGTDNLEWAGVKAYNLYVTYDASYAYFGAEIKASSWQAWAFAINTKPGGGSSDSWSRQINFGYTNLPDFIARGHFNAYAAINYWDGSSWQGHDGLASSEYGENITGNDQDGWVEIRVPISNLNAGVCDVQFYLTGDQNSHGLFDACPSDVNATMWNQSPPNVLTNYASNVPLPIQLASFVGSYVENGAKLEWSTISEVNNYGFNVQRQSGNEYVNIGFVEGKGVPSTYEYIDAQAGTTYRLEQIDNDGLTTYYGPIMLNPNSVGDNIPAVFALNQNYPNPFNPSTVINYQLATDNYTTLEVYNLIGKEVATLVNGYVTAGSHQVTFDGSHLTSGMYFYKLQSGNNVEVKKLTLVK